ncbi:N-formylglutamate amidohydrolase [Parasphingorhabdus cellanae]|uniref:N-formylglutamate amidohydrolase n=1 Tax=Parasphingorhabdus cellanae TaxID=2806553 RepID=A0ABX7T7J7_9SPHN|nr:N-formylglutamate amidohydrolase [Parasphingorhabdus cellanae]QTD57593.1 N-formylglutamate amidohydrolase [Parasphingorhabdus cellanae]
MPDQIDDNLLQSEPYDGPFSFYNIDDLQFPLLISVPHAGRLYPEEIVENLAVPATHLLRLEDRYADRLASSAIAAGFPAIIARRPRAWVDLNRNRSEIDTAMVVGLSSSQLPTPSRKVRGGLGVVPSRLHGIGTLWKKKWAWEDISNRLECDHEPYHSNITTILENMRRKFGGAILLDLHSMPPLDEDDSVDIVIGDRFGRSAGSRYSELSLALFRRSGIAARLNHPYAGGYILERHSKVEADIHALQLEVNRACYLDAALREPGDQISMMADHIENLSRRLADQVSGQFLLAAE